MEDFLKQFRQNLERRPEPPFEERDWQNLQKRLDQQREKRPLAFAWLPLLLLSFGTSAFFFFQMKKAERKIAALEICRDTVFQTKIIYKTDTIYRTQILRERVGDGLSVFAVSPSGNLIQEQKLKLPPSMVENEISPENQHVVANFDPLPPPEILPVSGQMPPLPDVYAEPFVLEKKKTFRQQYLYPLHPKGFRLGVAGGWAYPFSGEVNQQGGYSLGGQAAVEFSPHLQLWLDATYFKATFETDRMGDDISVPPVAPPSDQFVFVNADVPQPSWQFSAGMQYFFRADKKFKPLAGMGWGAVSLLPYEVIYEFENQALGVEWSLEKNVSRQAWLTNFLFLRAGFGHEFAQKWHWQFLTTYRLQIGETDFQTPHLLGLQAGLMRRF
jgi:hypothetical protein